MISNVISLVEYFPFKYLIMFLAFTAIIGKSSVYVELLVPLRLVAILETNKLKLLSFSFMISK